MAAGQWNRTLLARTLEIRRVPDPRPRAMATKDLEKLRLYRRRWYTKNSERQKARQKVRRIGLWKWIQEYRSTQSCTDCGMSFAQRPECCDFHHLDPSVKEGSMYQAARSSIARAKREIAKCVPLCANCHRTRHARTHLAAKRPAPEYEPSRIGGRFKHELPNNYTGGRPVAALRAHGTNARYRKGCHCEACVSGHNKQNRSYETPESRRARYLRTRNGMAERGEPESHAARDTVCFPDSPRTPPGSRSRFGGRR